MYKINYSYIFCMSIFFLYEHIFYKLYVQVKFKFMKKQENKSMLIFILYKNLKYT
jgi:hypothetical protein